MQTININPYSPWKEAYSAAVDVLLHNMHGPFDDLPRTAGWGYPEPYTRDLMISALGILSTGNEELIGALQRVLIALAANQTPRGHIPSLAHDPADKGASDTTPLFLIALELYRQATGRPDFLAKTAHKALQWMQYQSPEDGSLIGQLPTSDWRDEQWVMGYGLYVNSLAFIYLRLFGLHDRAAELRKAINRLNIRTRRMDRLIPEGLRISNKPYYAICTYKALKDEHFDLLGNSLAIIGGVASPDRSRQIIDYVEASCEEMRRKGELVGDLPPCFFPYILPGDEDWHTRYFHFNKPGEYHNGGIWPFVAAFYVVALVAAGQQELAVKKLNALTQLVKIGRGTDLNYGFNEWFRATDGQPMGQDWQTWSAAMYIYAVSAVETGIVPGLEDVRKNGRIGGENPNNLVGNLLSGNRNIPTYGSIDEML
jgi:hypothetical protein